MGPYMTPSCRYVQDAAPLPQKGKRQLSPSSSTSCLDITRPAHPDEPLAPFSSTASWCFPLPPDILSLSQRLAISFSSPSEPVAFLTTPPPPTSPPPLLFSAMLATAPTESRPRVPATAGTKTETKKKAFTYDPKLGDSNMPCTFTEIPTVVRRVLNVRAEFLCPSNHLKCM